MTRADELRADLRQRKAQALADFQAMKFGGVLKEVRPIPLAVVDAGDIATPSIPSIPGLGRRR